MQKHYLFPLLVLFLTLFSQTNAQERTYVGKVKDVVSVFKNRADAAKKLRGETTISVPQLGKKQLTLKVNSSKPEGGGDLFFGEVSNIKNGKFFLKIQGSVATGNIMLPDEKRFLRYSSTTDGSVYLTEEDIDKVLCIGMPMEVKSDAQTTPQSVQVANAAVPPPSLQSLPGATAVLYLDFDGQTVVNTYWNNYNNGNPIVADHSHMSEFEMVEIWKLISEDYRPFTLNVTTDEIVFNSAPINRRMRVIFTPTNYFLPGYGGSAFIGSFTWGGTANRETPCWAWNSTIKAGGDVGSHEAGHTLTLGHDGRTVPVEEYYWGNNNWAPIMGASYGALAAQWSDGGYVFASNKEDDVEKIATLNGFGYRMDDHGNDLASATPLIVDGSGNALADDNKGLITSRNDVDVFSFVSSGGLIEFRIEPEPNYPNLDIFVTIRNSEGVFIGEINPSEMSASQGWNLSPGTFYLEVDGARGDLGAPSDYGSLGSYSIAITTIKNYCSVGYIQREYWEKVFGEQVTAVPINTPPTSTSLLFSFEAPSNITNNYGQRIRGYLCPSVTGSYTFYIASDNAGELWLSSNDNAASKKRIAYSSDWVSPREWTMYPSQKSTTITLEAGTRYYIEALHLEGGGGDNLAVGWTTPGSTAIEVIPRYVLSPYLPANQPPTVTLTTNGSSFTAPAEINITATASDADGSVAKVEFYQGGIKLGEVLRGNFEFSWKGVGIGTYTLTAKATDNSGSSTMSNEVIVTVTQGTGDCGQGYIMREFWDHVFGEQITSIPINTSPTSTSQLSSFEAPANVTNNYGQRIRGYLCPLVSGGYTFYIASDNAGELWLSTNDNAASKKRIAYSPEWVSPREWTRYASQKSVTINLQAGTRYYIEALHLEEGGGDNLAVGWTTPGSTAINVIPGSVLSPFPSGANTMASKANMRSYSKEFSIKASPNPTTTEFTLVVKNPGNEAVNIKVFDGVGRIVESRSGVSSNSILRIGGNYRPGIYYLEMISADKRVTLKLIKGTN